MRRFATNVPLVDGPQPISVSVAMLCSSRTYSSHSEPGAGAQRPPALELSVVSLISFPLVLSGGRGSACRSAFLLLRRLDILATSSGLLARRPPLQMSRSCLASRGPIGRCPGHMPTPNQPASVNRRIAFQVYSYVFGRRSLSRHVRWSHSHRRGAFSRVVATVGLAERAPYPGRSQPVCSHAGADWAGVVMPGVLRTPNQSVQRTAGHTGLPMVLLDSCVHGFRGGSLTSLLGVCAMIRSWSWKHQPQDSLACRCPSLTSGLHSSVTLPLMRPPLMRSPVVYSTSISSPRLTVVPQILICVAVPVIRLTTRWSEQEERRSRWFRVR